MLLTLIALALLNIGQVKGHTPNHNITRCDQLPTVPIVLPTDYLYNPYKVWFSMDPTFNCTTAITTGPAPLYGENATFIIIQENRVLYSFSVAPADNNSATLTMTCDKGDVNLYKFMIFEVTEDVTHICPFVCQPNGIDIKIFRCYGHTTADRDYIRAAIDEYMVNVPGYANITDMQVDCADAQDEYCEGYFI